MYRWTCYSWSLCCVLLTVGTLFPTTRAFFVTAPRYQKEAPTVPTATLCKTRSVSVLSLSQQPDAALPEDSKSNEEGVAETQPPPQPQNEEEKEQAVGNLVANDEWEGLTMELSQLIQTAVVEDIKANAREFLGKDDYKLGDFSKEMDSRIKQEVANLRGKENYELGDLVVVVDTMAKDMTSDLTGKPYETGDLSKELDKRIKTAVASYCGKEEYEFGDLTAEIDRRVKNRVAEYLGNDKYEFGDITREIEKQRREWVKDYLGEEAAANYQFGDITKKAISNFTGKDTYEFGDITKKLMGNIFKKK